MLHFFTIHTFRTYSDSSDGARATAATPSLAPLITKYGIFPLFEIFCSLFTSLCLLDTAIKDKLTHKALVGTSICSVSRLQSHRLVGGGHLAHLWNGSLNGSAL